MCLLISLFDYWYYFVDLFDNDLMLTFFWCLLPVFGLPGGLLFTLRVILLVLIMLICIVDFLFWFCLIVLVEFGGWFGLLWRAGLGLLAFLVFECLCLLV